MVMEGRRVKPGEAYTCTDVVYHPCFIDRGNGEMRERGVKSAHNQGVDIIFERRNRQHCPGSVFSDMSG